MLVKSEHSSLIWKASANVLPANIPELVDRVAKEDGKYLIYKNEYINVQAAMKHKAYAEKFTLQAKNQLLVYESTSDESEQYRRLHEMIQSAHSAGSYFRLYVRDVNASHQNNINPEMPVLAEAHPELLKAWQRGYDEMGSQLYEEPN